MSPSTRVVFTYHVMNRYACITVCNKVRPWVIYLLMVSIECVCKSEPIVMMALVKIRHRSKKTSKLRVTGLCEGNSPAIGEFPAQRTSNAEIGSIFIMLRKIFIRLPRYCIYHDNCMLIRFQGHETRNSLSRKRYVVSLPVLWRKNWRQDIAGSHRSGWHVGDDLEMSDMVWPKCSASVRQTNWTNSQIPECTCTISHNDPFRTEMCTFLFWVEHCGIWNMCILGFVFGTMRTFLFWMEHCGIWNRCILGFVKLAY